MSIFLIAALKLNGVSATIGSTDISLSAPSGVLNLLCKVTATRVLHAPPECKANYSYDLYILVIE